MITDKELWKFVYNKCGKSLNDAQLIVLKHELERLQEKYTNEEIKNMIEKRRCK